MIGYKKKKEKEKTKSSCLKFDYQNAIASQIQLLIQALRGRVPLSASQRARLSRVLGVSGGRLRVPRVRRAREPVFPGHPGKNKRFITTQFELILLRLNAINNQKCAHKKPIDLGLGFKFFGYLG